MDSECLNILYKLHKFNIQNIGISINIVVGVEGSAQLAKWVSNVSGWKTSLFFDKFEKQHFEQKQKVIARRAFVNCSSSCFHFSLRMLKIR